LPPTTAAILDAFRLRSDSRQRPARPAHGLVRRLAQSDLTPHDWANLRRHSQFRHSLKIMRIDAILNPQHFSRNQRLSTGVPV